MQINRLNFTEQQLKRIKVLTKEQQEKLSLICSALAIDGLYVFSESDNHPLGDYLCDIADRLRIQANVTQDEYHYLCGVMGAMDLDKIIDFVIKKTRCVITD